MVAMVASVGWWWLWWLVVASGGWWWLRCLVVATGGCGVCGGKWLVMVVAVSGG